MKDTIAFIFLILMCGSIGGGMLYQTYILHWQSNQSVIYNLDNATMEEMEIEDKEYVGVCWDNTLSSTVSVYTADLPGDVIGRFIADKNMIIISKIGGFSVQNIAHEVSHLVDDIIFYKGIRDGETRAYLQGYFTDCIYKLLLTDRNLKAINF